MDQCRNNYCGSQQRRYNTAQLNYNKSNGRMQDVQDCGCGMNRMQDAHDSGRGMNRMQDAQDCGCGMNRMQDTQDCGCGAGRAQDCGDAMANAVHPVGMAYITSQPYENLYNAKCGLEQGTMFMALNLIFCGVRGTEYAAKR